MPCQYCQESLTVLRWAPALACSPMYLSSPNFAHARYPGTSWSCPPSLRVGSGLFPIVRPPGQGHAGVMNTTTSSSQPGQSTAGAESAIQARPNALSRSRDDRMLAGVASGIAACVGVDALFVRIAFAVLTIVGGVGIPLYLACWLLIPDEQSSQSIAGDFVRDIQSHRN